MSSIIIYNDEGSVLYQNNFVGDVQKFVKTIQDSGDVRTNQPIRINGMIILADKIKMPERNIPKLTAKQFMVLQCLASSLTSEQTAIKMCISLPTVRMHIRTLKKKFNTDSRDQLMAMAGCLGLCDPFQNELPNMGQGNKDIK